MSVNGHGVPELADLTESILADLPGYYAQDVISSRLFDCLARELEKLQATADQIRREFFSIHATNTYGILRVHENGLGLPEAPDKSVEQRQDAIRGAVNRRFSPRGTDWREAVSFALGTSDWTVIPHWPNDYEITIVVPFRQGQNEINTLTVNATAGNYKLIVNNGASTATTAAILSTATAATIKTRITGGGVFSASDVNVTGGPGGAGGGTPYVIEFVGAYANRDVPEIIVTQSALTGGAATATVALTQEGSDGLLFNSVEPLIRPFTPANLDIVVTAEQGFIVGVSRVGEEII